MLIKTTYKDLRNVPLGLHIDVVLTVLVHTFGRLILYSKTFCSRPTKIKHLACIPNYAIEIKVSCYTVTYPNSSSMNELWVELSLA